MKAIRTVDETDKEILRLIKEGKTYRHISFKLGVKYRNIVYRVQLLKAEYGCESLPQLLSHPDVIQLVA